MILSIISLPRIKALWLSEITSSNIFFSLLARVLAIILYNTLHKLVGQNSLTEIGFLTLGIKPIYVKLWRGPSPLHSRI